MPSSTISRETGILLRGAGILLIVLHNFFHNIPPLIGQNEFLFNMDVTEKFISTMLASPTEWLRALSSYLGHYGVQLFIFLSAYGLTRRYSAAGMPVSAYLKARFGKIYLSFLICVVVYILLGLLKSALLTDEKVLYWDSLAWMLLLVSNFVPGQAMLPVGPWWFIPFILQFYLVYPLLRTGYRRFGAAFLVLLAVASMVAEWLYNPRLIANGLNLNYMAAGQLPVICLGIYLASRPQLRIHGGLVVVALVLFLHGCINATTWIASDICATIVLLAFFEWLFRKLQAGGSVIRILAFYGVISFHLFMVNGFLRSPFHDMALAINKWWFTILCGMASLLFSTLFAYLLMKLDRKARSLVTG